MWHRYVLWVTLLPAISSSGPANLKMPLVQRLSPPSRASRLRRSSGSVPELLDAVVAAVGHIDVAGGVDSYATRIAKLPVARSRVTPLSNESTTRVEFLDAVVPSICNVEADLRSVVSWYSERACIPARSELCCWGLGPPVEGTLTLVLVLARVSSCLRPT